jgi:sterol desaturase/sphingolipid hydroxylase (fatty acid hydroxylase superfamily)
MLRADTLTDASLLVFTLVVGVMLALERLLPLVTLLPRRERLRHAARNLGLSLTAGGVALLGGWALAAAGTVAQAHGFGLLNLLDPPFFVRFLAALVVIDFFEWVRHRLHHRVPVLWRLHRVHHSDPDVDATTSVRGHPIETAVAYTYFSVVVLLLGADALSLALRTLVTVTLLAFHHSALRLPPRLDAALSLVTPTPRTHRLHHSREVRFTDSNYGTVFTWWDRLLGTFTPGERLDPHARTGLNGFDAPDDQTIWGILKSPWRDVPHDSAPKG